MKDRLSALLPVSDPSGSDGGAGSFTQSPLSGNIVSFEHRQGCPAGAGTCGPRWAEWGIPQEGRPRSGSPQGVLRVDFPLCPLSMFLGSPFFSLDPYVYFCAGAIPFYYSGFVECFAVRNTGCNLSS